MQSRKFFRAIRPFFSAILLIVTAAVLISVVYFAHFDSPLVMFLAGILVAAIIAETTRRSNAEWALMRRTAQLSKIKPKLERESQLRKLAEKAVADGKPRLHLIDEVLPTMIAFVDRVGLCQYHNRAFMDWLRLRPEQIGGRHMREVLGTKVYQETAAAVRQSLDGHAQHFERTQKMPDGAVYRLAVEHLPQFGEDGKVTGFYMLINDITEPDDVRQTLPGASDDQTMFVDAYSEQVAADQDAGVIKKAIENGEFNLLCQLITPLPADSGEAGHYEILVRLEEEEGSMLPPGTFFPLAEKHGLMPHLDRWVVQHVCEWVAHKKPEAQGNSMYFINVSGATIADSGFPEFLQLTLLEYGVTGAALCFEISDTELSLNTAEVAEFARQVRQCGCRVALSGFGRDRVLFDLIRGFQVEFLKIDGRVILDILRDPVKLAKVTAINRVAKKIGVKTIAEMVESEEIIAKLRETGIDFAQGFGISRPRTLAE
jgi:PAS domain S-box-containing protein